MPQPVHIELDKHRKLQYRHQDLRDVVATTGKQVEELLRDPFYGWAHLLQFGLRFQDPKITLNKTSELIDLWVEKHSDEPNAMDGLGAKLIEALEASNFLKIQRMDSGEESGNGRPTSVTVTTEP